MSVSRAKFNLFHLYNLKIDLYHCSTKAGTYCKKRERVWCVYSTDLHAIKQSQWLSTGGANLRLNMTQCRWEHISASAMGGGSGKESACLAGLFWCGEWAFNYLAKKVLLRQSWKSAASVLRGSGRIRHRNEESGALSFPSVLCHFWLRMWASCLEKCGQPPLTCVLVILELADGDWLFGSRER